MSDLPNNSDRARVQGDPADDPRAQKIVEGNVVQRKKPFVRRLKEAFIAGEAVNFKEYIVFEMIVPAVRDTIRDVLMQSVERTIPGSSHSPRAVRRSGSMNSHINYNRSSNSPLRRNEPREVSQHARANHDFNEIILDSYAEADLVLDRLNDSLEKYGKVSVAALYSFVGITPSFTDERWGWIDLRTAGVSRLRGGQYLLNLPDPEPIRN